MRDALAHRGPDDADSFQDEQASLGHRRLSIVDLSRGRQPAFNEDRTVVVVFNGEIYNHRDVRLRLEPKGHVFASAADTESIVHAYEAYGRDCPKFLDGMFAFVVYDMRQRLLFGARDRLGKKPLYYTTRPFGDGAERVTFAFASELKSLRKHPAIERSWALSHDGLVSYLANDYVAAGRCILDGIAKLEPGCAFIYGLPGSEREGLRTWRYWDIALAEVRQSKGHSVPSETEAGRRVIELLTAAVEKRLMADVPLGAFLSGGIDSSSVVALMTRFRPAAAIKTFSISFDESSFDESAYAETAARHFGTDHYTWRFTADDLVGRLPALIEMLDEPFADPSILPVSMLCEFARQQVTVTLGGDGGDELFAGYDPFRAVHPGHMYGLAVPGMVHRALVEALARLLPASTANLALDFKIARFLRGAKVEPERRLPTWMGAFSLEQLREMLPDLGQQLDPEHVYGPMISAYRRLANAGARPFTCALDFFERFYLPDDILVKIDRAGMMHSLEVRAPFLDTALVEYVNALPNWMKYRRGETKHLLKRTLAGELGLPALLPRSIVYRKKKGFGIPVAQWIRGRLRSEFRRLLVDDWPEALPMFDRRAISRLLAEHTSGRRNHYKELWALWMLAHWGAVHLA